MSLFLLTSQPLRCQADGQMDGHGQARQKCHLIHVSWNTGFNGISHASEKHLNSIIIYFYFCIAYTYYIFFFSVHLTGFCSCWLHELAFHL